MTKRSLAVLLCGIDVLGGALALLLYGSAPKGGDIEKMQSAARIPPTGFKEFRSDAYHFSLFYPDELLVGEREEVDGAHTFVFENASSTRGFQIFVVPYFEEAVSAERLKKDLPSGVIKEQQEIVVGGDTKGMIFYSTNALLGETREVWFIKNKFLYEVNTYKKLDVWLSQIIGTLVFI